MGMPRSARGCVAAVMPPAGVHYGAAVVVAVELTGSLTLRGPVPRPRLAEQPEQP